MLWACLIETGRVILALVGAIQPGLFLVPKISIEKLKKGPLLLGVVE
jgi:hypothetical protein